MPHDTWALSEGRLDEKAFLELTDEILNENKLILNEGLKEFKTGVFFYYFEVLDAIQHMFWSYIDPKSPLYEANSEYSDTIYKYYEKMDQILGDILKKVNSDTTLIVISDHGFGPFRRSVHLNRWLLENGYLVLTDAKNEGREFFEDVDWAKTKAYALGFGGIYLNRTGREGQGIVRESEAEQLKRQIQEKLKQWQDTATGENVVKEAYDADDIFNGPYKKDAPDVFVGFNSGYRASWQTALGGTPNLLIEDNLKKWSGDHLVDPGLVPGVIFINKKVKLNKPKITDIADIVLTILQGGKLNEKN
jgi:predicted AlkP superfamily phosphohydrolase/phosphomutase